MTSVSDNVINQATSGNSIFFQNALVNPSASVTPNYFANNSLTQTTPQNNQSNSSDLTNALQTGKSVNNLLDFTGNGTSSTGVFSGLGNSINAWGAENLGTGFGGAAGTGNLAAETISPELAAADPSLGLATSTAAGEAADGALGASSLLGLAGSALGGAGIGSFINKNSPVNGAIGGAIGGVAGSALASAAGAAAGIEAGAAIGSVVPVVGTVIGAVVGGLASTLFGPGKATQASEGDYQLQADGTLKETNTAEKNAGNYTGYNTALGQNLNAAFTSAQKALGMDFPTDSLHVGVNTQHSPASQPGFIQIDGQTYGFDPNDLNSQNQAITQAIMYAARQNGATDAQLQTMATKMQQTPPVTSTTPTLNVNNNTGPSQFEQFLTQYKASQNANAAPSSSPATTPAA